MDYKNTMLPIRAITGVKLLGKHSDQSRFN